MSPEQEINIAKEIGVLQGQISEGFKAIGTRLDTINGRVGKMETNTRDLERRVDILESKETEQIKKDDITTEGTERRKNWYWGVVEKLIFMIIIPLIGLILINLHIINLIPVK